ncbi:MAG: glycosyltransferase family 4 protein [Bdellovibrionaceae bacterium]|jgi:1,2-diacylglycerol 3-alpha-glucosyltransferase|nr:glycosyltransferase family 4 protein [Pseudobdellovibrionaceae bacterium]
MWPFKKKVVPEQLNICIITDRLPISGKAIRKGYVWPVARSMVKKGHKVTLISWRNSLAKAHFQNEGVDAYFVGDSEKLPKHLQKTNPQQFNEALLEFFKKLHSEKQFDIVHSLSFWGLIIAKNKRKLKIPVVFNIHAIRLSKLIAISGRAQESALSILKISLSIFFRFLTYYYSGDRSIVKSADGIFVTSPQQGLLLERYYLYPEKKTFLLPYGIDIGQLPPVEKTEQLMNQLNLSSQNKVAVTITDMAEFEELKVIIRAFEKVSIKKPAARLIIIGHGPLKKEIEFEVLQLALGSKVIFTGDLSQDDLTEYISLSDIFINISSRTTGFEPNTLEAMAQKKVIIGSEVSPISSIVEDGIDGFLIRPADINFLSQLIIKILDEKISAQTIGERARKKIMDLFDIDKMVKQTLTAYKKIIAHN